jgi:hypothetical protein
VIGLVLARKNHIGCRRRKECCSEFHAFTLSNRISVCLLRAKTSPIGRSIPNRAQSQLILLGSQPELIGDRIPSLKRLGKAVD